MKIPANYIEDLKNLEGSYYKAAKKIKISIQALGKLRDGDTIPKDNTCIEIAQALNIEEREVLLSAAIARSGNNSRLREVWENISRKAGYLFFPIGGASSVEQWLEGQIDVINYGVLCILCKIRKHLYIA